MALMRLVYQWWEWIEHHFLDYVIYKKQKELLSDTLHVSIEEQAFMLESLIGVKFLLSRVTVSWYFNYVLCAIREYLNELI